MSPKQIISFMAALSLGQALFIVPNATAETVTRANARCKLSVNKSIVFDNHCVFKHKERNNKSIFSIDLDNWTVGSSRWTSGMKRRKTDMP